MEKVVLKANKRSLTGKQVKTLRHAGQLPGVLYGHGVKPTPIVMDAHDAKLTLGRSTSSSLITLNLEGKEYPTLVREKQRDFIKNYLLHVDFQVVSMTEKIRAHISIELTGASPAVNDFNAIIVTGLNELEVESLPNDLPERIVVDIASLVNIGEGIHVRDLTVPDKVKVLDDPDEMIAFATAPKEEVIEEVVPEVAVEEMVEPELIEKGKKEEEVPEEGAEEEKK